jgi:hydrogenase maturation factor
MSKYAAPSHFPHTFQLIISSNTFRLSDEKLKEYIVTAAIVTGFWTIDICWCIWLCVKQRKTTREHFEMQARNQRELNGGG